MYHKCGQQNRFIHKRVNKKACSMYSRRIKHDKRTSNGAISEVSCKYKCLRAVSCSC